MIDHFILRALLVAVLLAALCGPLGCFVIWRRLSIMGDTLSHSALLGVCLALMLHLPPIIGMIASTVFVATTLQWLDTKAWLSRDTLLAILSQVTLAVGIIALNLSGLNGQFHSYLFGDLVAIDWWDVSILSGASVIIFGVLTFFWKDLLKMTLSTDMASVQGVKTKWVHFIFVLTLALFVALASRSVGVLLTISLLIIPTATARPLAKNPLDMALKASFFALLSVAGGFAFSFYSNAPTAPCITATGAILFIATYSLTSRR